MQASGIQQHVSFLPHGRRASGSPGPLECCCFWWWSEPCRASPEAGRRSGRCPSPQRCAACLCSWALGRQPGVPRSWSESSPQTAAIRWPFQPWCTPPLPTAPVQESRGHQGLLSNIRKFLSEADSFTFICFKCRHQYFECRHRGMSGFLRTRTCVCMTTPICTYP